MKTPGFWYRPCGWQGYALAPLGWAFDAMGHLRQALAAEPYRAPVPVICVGNVVAGGAGKTPIVLALAGMLKSLGKNPVLISRGYGGNLRGPVKVVPGMHTAAEVGDEALLLAAAAPCWIGRDRAAVIRAATSDVKGNNYTHVIMDDGLQNPHVAPHVALLVVDGETGFGNGMIVPAGPLRESPQAALRRSDAVVMVGRDANSIVGTIGVPVIRATLAARLSPDFPRDKSFLAFAGIGRPAKFYNLCRDVGLDVVETWDFPDHHPFSRAELEALRAKANARSLRLLTTAKDAVRLPEDFFREVAVLPVEAVFAGEEGDKLAKIVMG